MAEDTEFYVSLAGLHSDSDELARC